MDTEIYCKTLDKLDSQKAIRAIHEAFVQLKAIGNVYTYYDNVPVLDRLEQCLKDAGHIGFTD